MEFTVLMTGSETNCSILKKGSESLMIDAGFKTKKMLIEKTEPFFDREKILGVIFTHEHNDHLSPWSGRMCIDKNIPMFLHPKHYEKEAERKNKYLSYIDKRLGEEYKAKVTDIKEDNIIEIGSFKVLPFTAYHDAAKTLGFVIDGTFGYLADCGFISNNIKEKLLSVESLALEFNYDITMLLNSERHFSNKIRTMYKFGHLSNEEAIKFCKFLIKNGNLKRVITLHPSNGHNNLELLEEILKKELNIEVYVSQRSDNKTIKV